MSIKNENVRSDSVKNGNSSARPKSSRVEEKPDTVKQSVGKVNNTNANASPQKKLGKKANESNEAQKMVSP